jgi:hypothetical protein
VVSASEAGVAPGDLTMPSAFDRLAAPPVFICGSARSGTTWTSDLFAGHPEVHTVRESWVLTQTHGVTSILTQPHWNPAARDALQERVDIPVGAVQLVSFEETVRELGELVARWLMRGVSSEHRYLAVKDPIDVGATAILFPAARFIHVIRDGRDVALSMRRASSSWDPSMGTGLSITFRAEAWRRQVESVRAHRASLADRYLEIRYEELQADIAAQMSRLFRFSGISFDDALLGNIREATEISSYGHGVQTGFRGGGRDTSWRDEFTLREAIGFHRAAGDLLTELGYERGSGWWRALLPGWPL